MKNTINFIRINASFYNVKVSKKILGDLIKNLDGLFYFYIDEQVDQSACSSYILRSIADKLDELNKEWNDIINNDPKLNGLMD